MMSQYNPSMWAANPYYSPYSTALSTMPPTSLDVIDDFFPSSLVGTDLTMATPWTTASTSQMTRPMRNILKMGILFVCLIIYILIIYKLQNYIILSHFLFIFFTIYNDIILIILLYDITCRLFRDANRVHYAGRSARVRSCKHHCAS